MRKVKSKRVLIVFKNCYKIEVRFFYIKSLKCTKGNPDNLQRPNFYFLAKKNIYIIIEVM